MPSPQSLLRLAALGCAALAATALLSPAAVAGEPTRIGAPLTVETATPIADILADPAAYEGEQLRVEGQAVAVCQVKGCWMTVRNPQGQEIRIQVEDDGPVVFPKDAPGRTVAVEGTLERIPMERDQWIAWRQHLADDAGEPFDASQVPTDGPFYRVELRGLGAEIEGGEVGSGR